MWFDRVPSHPLTLACTGTENVAVCRLLPLGGPKHPESWTASPQWHLGTASESPSRHWHAMVTLVWTREEGQAILGPIRGAMTACSLSTAQSPKPGPQVTFTHIPSTGSHVIGVNMRSAPRCRATLAWLTLRSHPKHLGSVRKPGVPACPEPPQCKGATLFPSALPLPCHSLCHPQPACLTSLLVAMGSRAALPRRWYCPHGSERSYQLLAKGLPPPGSCSPPSLLNFIEIKLTNVILVSCLC